MLLVKFDYGWNMKFCLMAGVVNSGECGRLGQRWQDWLESGRGRQGQGVTGVGQRERRNESSCYAWHMVAGGWAELQLDLLASVSPERGKVGA